MSVLRVLPLLMLLCAACSADTPDPGATPGEPLALLSDAELGRFLLGRAVFERIAAPEEGLGPLFNADRCSSCHDSPAPGGTGELLVVKATSFDGTTCNLLEEEGGDNIQQRATPALAAHGITFEPVPAAATATARVTAPPLFGLGLVEAIPDADLIALEDPDDANGDGIRGRAPRLEDGRVARFGRKGETATLEGFIDTALRFELGLTTPANPHEENVGGTPLPDGVDPLPEPEIDANGVALLGDFSRFLAPPARAALDAAARAVADRGERVFDATGCASCHHPELRTGPSPVPALDRLPVRAYSDFLVHDLGPALASVCGARAAPSEWRTAPLWGLRFRDRFLYDGRAADLEAAIAAHGGEAEAVRARWLALGAEERAALLAFLRSL